MNNPVFYAHAVAQGAAFLDQHTPGWERRIDVACLDMNSHTSCIAAQAFEMSFDVFCHTYFHDAPEYVQDELISLGLTTPSPSDADIEPVDDILAFMMSCFAALGECWIQLLKERYNSGLLEE